jgi:hypothetical protein
VCANDEPLTRALHLARGLRRTFLLDVGDLQWFMQRWARIQGLEISRESLQLIAAAVVADDSRPLTIAEAHRIAESAAQDFARLDEARAAARHFAQTLGADAAQCVRLDTLVRKAWNARSSSTTPHIEKAA